MAIEHDYFGALSAGGDGTLSWSDRIDFADQSVLVDVTAADESELDRHALDAAARVVVNLEAVDDSVRRRMLSETDDRTSEVTEFILRAIQEHGDDLEDYLVDVSGDMNVDVIRSLKLVNMTILAEEVAPDKGFAIMEYVLDVDEMGDSLLVNLCADGSVESVISGA